MAQVKLVHKKHNKERPADESVWEAFTDGLSQGVKMAADYVPITITRVGIAQIITNIILK